MIVSLFRKHKFDIQADRLGPDLPFTHWRLFFKPLMKKLCTKKFKRFGHNAEFRPHAYAINCSKISIGNGVVIRPGSMFFADIRNVDSGHIIIENNVLIGSGVHIYTSNHKFNNPDEDIFFQGHSDAINTIIKHGAWIGANAIILPGVTIGINAVIGAGSVVTRDISDYTVAVGNPARVIKKLV